MTSIKYAMDEIELAHNFSMNHKEQLVQDIKCGCFCCTEIFNPMEIVEWVPDRFGTALCPYCGIDSIIGESSGFPITKDFLEAMKMRWFGEYLPDEIEEWNIKKASSLAQTGDKEAMYMVANYYMYGKPKFLGKKKRQLAFDYFMIAADSGNCDAMLDLGGLYLVGKHIAKDRTSALKWYKRAEESGAVAAYRCIGNYYRYDNRRNGRPYLTSDSKRIAQAYRYYSIGADHKDENCLYELGDMYLQGIGVAKDEPKGICLYQEAYAIAKSKWHIDGYNDSLVNVAVRLAKCFHYGIGTDKNLELAFLYINVAVEECKFWMQMKNVYGYAERKEIKKEAKQINRSINISPFRN